MNVESYALNDLFFPDCLEEPTTLLPAHVGLLESQFLTSKGLGFISIVQNVSY